MEFSYRHPNQHFLYPSLCLPDRSAHLSMSHVPRSDPRTCPLGGGGRSRGNGLSEEETPDSAGNARRRIAVACARCRKRKIRCSGDPGNGSGCTACKQAGVDVNLCQFHRVGSIGTTEAVAAYSALYPASFVNGVPNIGNPNEPVSLYNVGGSVLYPRPLSGNPYPQVDTKAAVYPQTWTIPCPEESSPVEAYGLDQASTYMPNPSSMTNVYSQNYRWSHPSQRSMQSGVHSYLGHDGSATYTTNGIPFVQRSNIRQTATTEALSPLNMTSISSALPSSFPDRSHTHREYAIPQRELPAPQPNPALNRNTVDMQQDKRLRSVQIMSGNPLNMSGPFVKPSGTWNTETSTSEVQTGMSSDPKPTELVAQHATSGSLAEDDVTGYVPITSSSSEANAITSSLTQFNFSTSPLAEPMTVPITARGYSNFRNHSLPTSSSVDSLSLLAQQASQSSIYSCSTEAKTNSNGDHSNKAALVSGQQYTPLNQLSKVQQCTASENRNVPVHRASLASVNCSF